jgi:signal transduction histidine kinase
LAAQSPEAIAQAAIQHIRQLVPCQRASVAVFDLESDKATLLAFDADGETKVGVGEWLSLDVFGITEELQQGNVIAVEDILAITLPTQHQKALQAEGIHSCITVPLISQDELIGSLNLGAEEPGAFTKEQIEISHEVADQLGVAIQQARLHEKVQRYATELEVRVTERTDELQARVAEAERLNQALTNLLEDLQSANRLTAETARRLEEVNTELETFAYSVSHDLRAPMRAMQGFAQALLEDYADRLNSIGQDYAYRIVAAASHMDTLIRDLLAYSRLTRAELHLKPVPLDRVVRDALEQLKAEIEEKSAQVIVESPLPEVVGHLTTLVQVVSNLLSNAVKFVAAGVQPQVRIWALASQTNVRLWVEDNGLGIAPEHQERIFNVFERLHGIETYPGTGIGLAIVRKGVERMGGRVGVESEAGRGSRFWVELPITKEKP